MPADDHGRGALGPDAQLGPRRERAQRQPPGAALGRHRQRDGVAQGVVEVAALEHLHHPAEVGRVMAADRPREPGGQGRAARELVQGGGEAGRARAPAPGAAGRGPGRAGVADHGDQGRIGGLGLDRSPRRRRPRLHGVGVRQGQAQQADAVGLVRQLEQGLGQELGAGAHGEPHPALGRGQVVPDLEMAGAGEVGRGAQARRADQPDLRHLGRPFEPGPPGGELLAAGLVRSPGAQEPQEVLRQRRLPRLLQDPPGEAQARGPGAAGERAPGRHLADPGGAELARAGVEDGQRHSPRRRGCRGREQGGEPLQERLQRRKRTLRVHGRWHDLRKIAA